MYLETLQENWAERLAWTLIHSIWLLSIIAIICRIVFLGFKSPRAQYAAGISALFAMPIVVISTFLFASLPISAIDSAAENPIQSDRLTKFNAGDVIDYHESRVENQLAPSTDRSLHKPRSTNEKNTDQSAFVVDQKHDWLDLITPSFIFSQSLTRSVKQSSFLVILIWLIGIVMVALRPIVGLRYCRRLRSDSLSSVSTRLLHSFQSLCEQHKIKKTVQIFNSTLAKVPMVVGYLRPMILLPTSLLSTLSAKELEAILLHELAHIRRHDYLINFLQTIIESAFFYHPAIWWISDNVRQNRELCCDDYATASQGHPDALAKALCAIAEHRHQAETLSVNLLAANGGRLKYRIFRLLGDSHSQQSQCANWLTLIVIVMAVVSFSTILIASQPNLQKPASGRVSSLTKAIGKKAQNTRPNSVKKELTYRKAPTDTELPWLKHLGSFRSPLGDFKNKTTYKVNAYLKAVVELQKMEESVRVDLLKQWASSKDTHQNEFTIILARLLFEAKKGEVFRRPHLGMPMILGGTEFKKIRSEPIEIVDGVPFLVVRGYKLGGKAEPASRYLAYCLKECQWTTRKFALKKYKQQKSALDKLIKSDLWAKKLSSYELEFLQKQLDDDETTKSKINRLVKQAKSSKGKGNLSRNSLPFNTYKNDDSAVGVWQEVTREDKPVKKPITWTITENNVKWSVNGRVVVEFRIKKHKPGEFNRLALYHILSKDIVVSDLEPLRIIYRRRNDTLELCYSVSQFWPLSFKSNKNRNTQMIKLKRVEMKKKTNELCNTTKNKTKNTNLEQKSNRKIAKETAIEKENRKFNKAIADYNIAIGLDPKVVILYLNRGRVWQRKKDFVQAMVDFNEAIRLNPRNADSYYYRGHLSYDNGEFKKAIKDYNKAIELDSRNSMYYAMRSLIWTRLGEKDKSLNDLNRAIQIDPKNVAALEYRSQLFFEQGDYSKALEDLNVAIRNSCKSI